MLVYQRVYIYIYICSLYLYSVCKYSVFYSICCIYGDFLKCWYPNSWLVMEIPIKVDDVVGTPILGAPIYIYMCKYMIILM